MGKGSKVILSGDVSQHDIAASRVSLPDFIKLIEKVRGVGTHIFNDKDIVRAKILQDIVRRYDQWRVDHEK